MVSSYPPVVPSPATVRTALRAAAARSPSRPLAARPARAQSAPHCAQPVSSRAQPVPSRVQPVASRPARSSLCSRTDHQRRAAPLPALCSSPSYPRAALSPRPSPCLVPSPPAAPAIPAARRCPTLHPRASRTPRTTHSGCNLVRPTC
ncbi:unnamed protein product [Closterium sp. Naga37s-1]|nr:unnamed protein product [Closterium sp. Naga37s-1]